MEVQVKMPIAAMKHSVNYPVGGLGKLGEK